MKQHSLSRQYFLIILSSHVTGAVFHQNENLQFWSCFKIVVCKFRRHQKDSATNSAQYHLPAGSVYTVQNECCDLPETDASLQSFSLRLSGTFMILRQLSWITQHVWVSACPVLHSTPRNGSFLLLLRMEFYNISAIMHSRNNLKASTQILHSVMQ